MRRLLSQLRGNSLPVAHQSRGSELGKSLSHRLTHPTARRSLSGSHPLATVSMENLPKYLITACNIINGSWDGSSTYRVLFAVPSQDYPCLAPGDVVKIAHDKNTEPRTQASSIFDYIVISIQKEESQILRIMAKPKTSPEQLLQETLGRCMPEPPQFEWAPKPTAYTPHRHHA